MILLAWLSSCALFALAVFLLLKGVKLIQKSTGGKPLLHMSLQQESASLTIPKEGSYTIWQSGRRLGKVPVQMPPPHIYNQDTGSVIPVGYSLSRMYVNNGSEGRIRLFTFEAAAGNYRLQLSLPNTPVRQEPLLSMLMPRKHGDITDYFLQIREQKPGYWLVFGVLFLIVAVACLVGALIMLLNADTLFA